MYACVTKSRFDFGTVPEFAMMDISLKNMKYASDTVVEYSLEATKWWPDDSHLRRGTGGLERQVLLK